VFLPLDKLETSYYYAMIMYIYLQREDGKIQAHPLDVHESFFLEPTLPKKDYAVTEISSPEETSSYYDKGKGNKEEKKTTLSNTVTGTEREDSKVVQLCVHFPL